MSSSISCSLRNCILIVLIESFMFVSAWVVKGECDLDGIVLYMSSNGLCELDNPERIEKIE
jgi:hypothetical protein